VSIVALITVAIGWREGIVVLVVIPTTILLTLFASSLMGYTINRVSLFALIFSIGILVDDAIVIVENISRHWHQRGGKDLVTTAVEAVAEVGNPTNVATLTIIVALLPMMFVSGPMGPYMSPIPASASMAMVFSFFVVITITPWLLYHSARRHLERMRREVRSFRRSARWAASICGLPARCSAADGGRRCFSRSLSSPPPRLVLCLRHRTLPSSCCRSTEVELQVVVDLPQGSTLEDTQRFLTPRARGSPGQFGAEGRAIAPEPRDRARYP